MGQRERIVRAIHGWIVDSGVFGSGADALVAMAYAPRVDGLPFCVYDLNGVEFLGEDNEPADQIVSADVEISIYATDGFSASRSADQLHDYLLEQQVVLQQGGLSTISEDYTAIGDRPRGLVRLRSSYTLDVG